MSIYPPFAPPSQGGRSLRAAVLFGFGFGLCLAAGAQLPDLLSSTHPRERPFGFRLYLATTLKCGALESVLARSGMLWGTLGRSGALRSALGRSGALQRALGHSLWGWSGKFHAGGCLRRASTMCQSTPPSPPLRKGGDPCGRPFYSVSGLGFALPRAHNSQICSAAHILASGRSGLGFTLPREHWGGMGRSRAF